MQHRRKKYARFPTEIYNTAQRSAAISNIRVRVRSKMTDCATARHDLLPSRRNKSTEQFARRQNATAQNGNISHYRACSVSAVNANAWHDRGQTIGTEYPPVPRDHRKHHINATLRRGNRDRQAGSKMPQSTGSLPLYAAYTHDPRQDKSAQTANDTARVPWRSATSDDRTCAVVVSIAQTPNFAAPCISAFTAALKAFAFDRHAL